MRAKRWSILAMVLAILILGGYVVVAATAPGAQSAGGTEIAKSGQAAALPGEITSEATSSQPPGSDLACPHSCTTTAQCQVAGCCDYPPGGACSNGRCLCP